MPPIDRRLLTLPRPYCLEDHEQSRSCQPGDLRPFGAIYPLRAQLATCNYSQLVVWIYATVDDDT